MAGFREDGDHAHLGFLLGVGGVDHAQGRLAPGHEGQGRADVVGGGDLAGDLVPDPHPCEGGLGVFAGGHAGRIGQGQASTAQGGQDRRALDQLQLHLGVGRGDQHQLVGEDVAARGLHHQVLALQEGHPVGVGGDEEVGRRALLDLVGDGGGAAEGEAHGLAGLGGIGLAGGAQRVLQGGGGEHGHGRAVGADRGGRDGQKPHGQQGGDEA